MRVLIDTNAYVALLAGDEDIAAELSGADAVLVSPVVIGELLDGFLGGSRERENRAVLKRFLAKPKTVIVPISSDSAEWFALIKRQLRAKGKPIPMNDVWIAASAMEHGARLLSKDAHFDAIEGLAR